MVAGEDYREFKTGNIIRIEMTNFMTFRHCVFNASPRLNIILGQNGSGKSTITCAVCLALGEDIRLLSRGSKLEEYIRYGEKEARIRIDLRGEQSNIIVEARIHKGSGEYFINGQSVRKEKLKELRRVLKIDLSNLCQFLPQDRVSDFVNQSAQARLFEFEKSVGGEELFNTHKLLINTQQQQNALHNEIEQKKQALDTAVVANQILQREKDKFVTLSDLIQEKKLLELHIKMLEYDNHLGQLSEIRQSMKTVKRKLTELQTNEARISSSVREYRVSVDDVKSLMMTEQTKGVELQRELAALELSDSQETRAYSQQRVLLENVDVDRRSLENELQSKQEELAQLEEDFQHLDGLDSLKKRISDIANEIDKLQQRRMEILTPLDGLRRRQLDLKQEENRAVMQLKALSDAEQQRRTHLMNIDMVTYNALQWLDLHRNLFQMAVYGPILNEVQFSDPLHMKWFENTISRNIMIAFVTQCADDYNLLVESFKKERIRANILMDSIRCDNLCSAEMKKKFGFTESLGDLIRCPDAVRRALYNSSSIRAVVTVGDRWSIPDAESVMSMLDKEHGMIVLTPQVQHRFLLSRYINTKRNRQEFSLQTVALRNPSLMVFESPEVQETENLNARISEIKDSIADIAKQIQSVEKEGNRFNEQIVSKTASRRHFEQLKTEYIGKRNRIRKLKRDIEELNQNLAKDFEEQKEKYRKEMKQILEKRRKLSHDRLSRLFAITKCVICKETLNRVYDARLFQLNELQTQLDSIKNERNQLSEEQTRLNQKREDLKRVILAMRSFIYTQSGLFHCRNNPNPDDFSCKCGTPMCQCQDKTQLVQDVFNRRFPRDRDRCIASLHLIDEKVAEVRVNERLIQEFEEREKLIEQLRSEIEDLEAQFSEHASSIVQKEENFINSLKRLVSKLDSNFSLFMKNIKCKGKIVLLNPSNFSTTGLDIQVSFRDDMELQSLNGQVQSGGEKSLSTILFLLSLQEMVSFPFRFIDEINQNMDARNERYVMQQLMYRGRSRSVAPQSFIITPKLLAKFPFDRNVTFHIIFQGQYLPDGFDWNTLVKSYRRLASEDPSSDSEESSPKRTEVSLIVC